MAKIRQSPKLPAVQRREQLLESAHRLFIQKGYRGTSTEEIARNAGLTKGALYFHFKNKEDILFGLIKMIVNDYQVTMENSVSGKHIDPADIVEMSLKYKGRAHVREFKSVLDIWVQAMRVPRIRKFINENYRRQIKFISEGLDPRLGLSVKQSRQLAVMILSMMDGLAARRCLDETLVDLKVQMQVVRLLFDRMAGAHLKTEQGLTYR
jgi:AcrR family transcriptional regulator